MTVVRLEGFHAVKHALRFAPHLVDRIEVADRGRARELADRLAPDLVVHLERAVTAAVDHPTGVQALGRHPPEDRAVLSSRTSPLLLLDRPRHPGNAGAAVRVAAASGASGVASTGELDPWHPAVLRGSAGLHYALPVLHCSADEVTGPLLVLDAGGERLADVPDDAVLVVGSERSGTSPELRTRAEAVVALPMRDGVSSLNLATAASAALYAWRLRR